MLTRVGVPVASETEPSVPDPQPNTLICFSHLRWNFVFQRPQHLMSRFARTMNVIYWEEPMEIGARETAYLQVREAADAPNVNVKDNMRHEFMVGSRIARESRESADSVKTVSRRAWQEGRDSKPGSPLDGGG